MNLPIHFADLIIVILFLPAFLLRAVHWVIDRKIKRSSSACATVDSFKIEFASFLSLIEVRPGRVLNVLRIPPRGASKGIIFFVHGACARMQQFVSQIRYFSEEGYEVVSFDALGCGESEIPVEAELYSSAEMYEDMVTLVERYTVQRGAVARALVGHSMGGAMLTKLAFSLDCSKLTESIVSLCNPDFTEMSRKTRIFEKYPASVLWLIRPLMGVKARELLFGPKASEALRAQEKEASARNPVYMFRSYYRGIQGSSFFHPESMGRSLAVRTLFVGAELDKISPCVSVESLASYFVGDPAPRFQLVRGCGHQCMQEDPDQVNALISDFLTV